MMTLMHSAGNPEVGSPVTGSLPPHRGLTEAMKIITELQSRSKITTPRKAERSAILTSSPYNKQLEEKNCKKHDIFALNIL